MYLVGMIFIFSDNLRRVKTERKDLNPRNPKVRLETLPVHDRRALERISFSYEAMTVVHESAHRFIVL